MPLYSELNELKKFTDEDFAILFKCPGCKEPICRGALVANRDMCPNCAMVGTPSIYGEPKVFDENDLDRYVRRETRALRRQLRAKKTIIETLRKLVLEIWKAPNTARVDTPV